MKYFASHYLYVPALGFLRKQVVEIDGTGYVARHFPLNGEWESVAWLPGVIVLSQEDNGKLQAFHLFPFDFEKMEPMGNSQRRRLL